MKPLFYFFLFVLTFISFKSTTFAQSEPVLYFCERYDDDKGEVNVSDRFTTGYLTVMVKCAYPLKLDDCSIQFDKYNERNGKFEYYKKFSYSIEKDMKYVFFQKNEDSDLKFEEPGFYRVFLLDEDDNTVTSSLIEIVSK
ncbi:MAG: hypothetical protein ACM3O3_12155 [Syntrophothermus sp.]|nr:hypothetical protein [Ignavibacteriaceae bacterium]